MTPGNKGVQQFEGAFEHEYEHGEGGRLFGLIFAVERALAQLDVPIAEVAPEEVVQRAGGDAQLELAHVEGDFFDGALQPRDDPLVGGGELDGGHGRDVDPLRVHQHEAGGVPHLVHEVARRLDLALTVAAVVAGRDARDEGETQRIGAVLVDHFQRIDAVAQRLGHLAALLVAHDAVQQHVAEGHLFGVLDAREDHAGDPEEDDVVPAGEHVRRVEVVEVGRLFGITEGREGPERRGEPGVEHVFVLL